MVNVLHFLSLRITDYVNEVIVRTLPIKPFGHIVYSLCFFGDNIFAIECILMTGL